MDHDLGQFEGRLPEILDVDADHDDIAEHLQCDTYRDREYFHLSDARHGVERGTVLVGDAVVRGFPSIPRVLVLDPGIPEQFDGRVAIEEKLNGYNVRVARADGEIFAFTRGGYICPFTTTLARDGPFAAFFDDYPEHTVCGELIGPANPYTQHDYEEVESAALRVFDVRAHGTGEPMPVTERYDCCEQYDLPTVPRFGVHDPEDAVDAVRETIADLDERGREGVILKTLDGTQQVKYTTSAIHRSDLEHAFGQPFEYGREFLFSRVLREAFQAAELDESEAETRERARALGESILLPAVETIQSVEEGGTVGDEHTVHGDAMTIESMLAMFRSVGLHLEIREDYYEDGERVVEFCKVADASRDKIQHYLDGGSIDQ
jgi:putative ATP-dependent DNA ligase